MSTKTLKCLAGTGLILAGSMWHASAATVLWQQDSGTHVWNDSLNWLTTDDPPLNKVPIGGDTAVINVPGTQVINMNSNPGSPASIYMGNTGVGNTLTLNFGAASYNPTSVILGFGDGDNIILQNSDTTVRNFRSQTGNFNVGASYNGSAGQNNTVTVSGAVTIGSASASLVVGSSNNNSGNTLWVKDGAAILVSRGVYVGFGNNASNNTLRLSGEGTTLTTTNSSDPNYFFSIGHATGSNGGKMIVEDGAAVNAVRSLEIRYGSVILNQGTITLSGESNPVVTLIRGAESRLEGEGSITAYGLNATLAGAVVEIGADGGMGILTTTLSSDAGWDNHNLTIKMQLGDITGMPEAGTDYDFLDVVGNFTLGGSVEIDLTSAVIPDEFDGLRIIGWTSYSGSVGDLSVNFIGGSPLKYEVLNDGLYLTAVPEPSILVLAGLGVSSLLFAMRRRRSMNNA